MELNNTLKNLIKYIRNKTTEIGWKKNDYGGKELYMIIGKYQADDFLEIIDKIEDGGYDIEWFGSTFYFELNGFLENECGVDTETFAFIMEEYIEN